MHYKAAWACGQAALRLAHMPTRRYDHHRLSPLVSTRNDEGPKVTRFAQEYKVLYKTCPCCNVFAYKRKFLGVQREPAGCVNSDEHAEKGRKNSDLIRNVPQHAT